MLRDCGISWLSQHIYLGEFIALNRLLAGMRYVAYFASLLHPKEEKLCCCRK